MMPEYVAEVFDPQVSAPVAPSSTLPAPVSEPIVSVKPARSSVAPPATVTAVESERT
jgi:hypothetical protein